MLEGTGLGTLDIIFALALVFFALWKKGWLRIILSLCIVTWGAFALQYDIKVAIPLFSIGTILFFTAIVKEIQQRRTEAEA